MSKSTLAFVSIVVLAGAAVLTAAAVHLEFDFAWQPVIALWLLGLLAEAFPVPVVRVGAAEAGSASVAAALYFAMVLSFPWPVVIICISACSLVGDALARKNLVKTLFNASQLALASLAASLIYRWGTMSGDMFSLSAHQVAWATVAAATFLFINSTATFTVVSLQQGIKPMRIIMGRPELLWYDIALYPLGMIVALMVRYDWHSLVLMLLPMWLVYRAFSNHMRLHIETTLVLERLADLVDQRDPYTARHSERVARLATRIARAMDLSEDEVATIYSASRLHDVGKIGWGNDILLKAGPLTEEERRFANQHPVIGSEIPAPLSHYRNGLPLIRHHHERMDGTGYPDGLAGNDIPIGARIICAADAYDAMTSDRPYRRALSQAEAISRLRQGAGTQFDPDVVEVLVRLVLADNDRQEGAEAADVSCREGCQA